MSPSELIHSQNVRRYRYELWTATDPDRRAMLLALIAAEDDRAAQIEGWASGPE